ncbi:MAG: M42 family metallopeptidase [Ruminococcaceae bacterium]|nr:M42 family metallopeptidase [Oscillospiraceae bacterium]
MQNLLQTLCDIKAPSGCESALADFISEELRPYADEIYRDALGNLIVHKKGPGKKLMFCAHMDELGVVATCYGEKGQIYVAALGGVVPHRILYKRVRFMNGTEGVIVPDGDENDVLKNIKMGKLYVDIGARDEKTAKAMVAIGESAVFVGDYVDQGDVIISKALDDRAGCYALMRGLMEAKQNAQDVYAVFTVSEELGLRGAKAVGVSISPDYAVALDVTRTGDTASGPKMSTALGKGAAIKIMDSSLITHPIVKERLKALCEKRNILWQPEVLERGGTDAGAVHLTGGGVPSGCISIPTRNIHSPGEMVDKHDLENVVALVTALIEEGM